MPTLVLTTDEYLVLSGVTTDGATTFTWTSESVTAANYNVFDQNDDGNIDSGGATPDNWQLGVSQPPGGFTADYFGFVTTINGRDYAIFEVSGIYFIPYARSIDDLGALLPLSVRTANLSEDSTPANFCFMDGTKIATPGGEALVEDLRIGDLVRTADGRDVPVKWIGRQHVACPANITLDEHRAPVCIQAGALGNHSDLYVSADHGMILDGYVINASALVNGHTIRFLGADEASERFTYYHIETEAHDVVLANGAPAETFIDVAGRTAFDNYQEYLDLYGHERIIPPLPQPRISSARLVPPAIRARVFGAAPDAGRQVKAG